MFVDPPHSGITVFLCHDCAHALCDAAPWVGRLLFPGNSHARSYLTYRGARDGWDLPHGPDDVTGFRGLPPGTPEGSRTEV